MNYLVREYFNTNYKDAYYLPKLILKTSPPMSVFGHDGSIYLKNENVVYHTEAKFFENLKAAIDDAVGSLLSKTERIDSTYARLFRNFATDNPGEIASLDKNSTEKVILFLMCDDVYLKSEIFDILNKNNKLKKLDGNYEFLVFVLPVLDKYSFLTHFKNISDKKWKELNE